MSKTCNPFGKECEQNTDYTAKEVVFNDRKPIPEFRIKNNSQHILIKIKVDGCLIKGQVGVRKCDFLLLDCTDSKAYFIELKGQNLKDAIVQITSTLSQLQPKLKDFKICCRIVQSKVIKATQQQEKKALLRFLKIKFPSNTIASKDLVRIESQKLIEQI